MKKNLSILFALFVISGTHVSMAMPTMQRSSRVPMAPMSIASGVGTSLSRSPSATNITASTSQANALATAKNDFQTIVAVGNKSTIGNLNTLDNTTTAASSTSPAGNTSSTEIGGATSNSGAVNFTNTNVNAVGTSIIQNPVGGSIAAPPAAPGLSVGGAGSTLPIASYSGNVTGVSKSDMNNTSWMTNNSSTLSQPTVATILTPPTTTVTNAAGTTITSTPNSSINIASQEIIGRNVGINSARTGSNVSVSARTTNQSLIKAGTSSPGVTISSNNIQGTGASYSDPVVGSSETRASNMLITGNIAGGGSVTMPQIPAVTMPTT